ncbi:MAG: putative metal-binding motif-containing protein, partial [Deltaproteobacteria bacterium]|nr:putative metal-binding motif-containing protein [Deltaproteobacteria bacterium]
MKTAVTQKVMFVLFFAALPLQLTCFPREVDRTGAGWCQAGYSDICYEGPEGSFDLKTGRGLGVCKSGQYYCWEETQPDGQPRVYRACRNQVVPSQEICNGLDDDCDGVVDNNGACSENTLAEFENVNGMTMRVMANDRIGPMFMANRSFGALYWCRGPDTVECAEDFLIYYSEKSSCRAENSCGFVQELFDAGGTSCEERRGKQLTAGGETVA